MTKERYEEFVEEIEMELDNLNIDEQYNIACEVLDDMGYYDDVPMVCDEYTVDDLAYGLSASEVLRQYGEIDFSWDYMIATMYGWEEWLGFEDTNMIAEYMLDNEDSYGNDDIQDIIDRYLEELEEEDEDEEDEE